MSHASILTEDFSTKITSGFGPGQDSLCNLGEVHQMDGASLENTREDFLLETIQMPQNAKLLTERLPRSNYGQVSPRRNAQLLVQSLGSQSKRESVTNLEALVRKPPAGLKEQRKVSGDRES